MKGHLLIEDGFHPGAKILRADFESKFSRPKESRGDRFVWDYWHVPGQYTQLRTPAEYFFPKAHYKDFLQRLGTWGRETLGCSAITPPWLSYYVDGCEQRLHADVPHGPWAFVFSLTPPKRTFRGGETMLLKPEVLEYWRGFRDADDREYDSFVTTVSPRFNRLVVFDPRLPHGVTPVRGTQDPMEARLAIHGWFTDPKPYLKGALSAARAAPVLDQAVEKLVQDFADLGPVHGIASLKIPVQTSGRAGKVKVLAHNLVSLVGREGVRAKSLRLLQRTFSGLRFPPASSSTEITLPLLFR